MIKHLIKLDFYAMKPLKKVILPFLLVPIVLGIVADLGMSIMVTLTFMVFMLNIVFAITEKSNFHKLYGTLPVKQSASILSRYLFSLIAIGITAILSFVIFIILSTNTAVFPEPAAAAPGAGYRHPSVQPLPHRMDPHGGRGGLSGHGKGDAAHEAGDIPPPAGYRCRQKRHPLHRFPAGKRRLYVHGCIS